VELWSALPPVEIEDEVIESEIHISAGEGKKFEAKNIKLNADIHCDGELAFENSVIVYNGYGNKSRIIMGENTSLTMSHCTFVGMNKENQTDDLEIFFIKGDNSDSRLIICRSEVQVLEGPKRKSLCY